MAIYRPPPVTGNAGVQPITPQTGGVFFGGKIVFSYKKNGTVTVSAAPRKRRRSRLNPLTQQMRRTWDAANYYIKFLAGREWQNIYQSIFRTTYAVRDLALMDCYGNKISWPGEGIYPDGKTLSPRPQILGFPQPINVITTFKEHNDGSTWTTEITTLQPANPKLLVFETLPRKIYPPKYRKGRLTYGKDRYFFPRAPTIYSPDTAIGRHFTWVRPAADIANDPVRFAIAELGGGTWLNWHTTVYPPTPISVAAVRLTDFDYLDSAPISNMPAIVNTIFVGGWCNLTDSLFTLADISGSIPFFIDIRSGTAPGANIARWRNPDFTNTWDQPVGLGSGWHSIAFSLNFTTKVAQLYVDGHKLVPQNPIVFPTAPMVLPDGDIWEFGYSTGSLRPAEFCNIYCHVGDEWINLDDTATYDRLFGPTNTFYDWHDPAHRPTLATPQIFLSGGPATFADNTGSGGPFTVGGNPLLPTATVPTPAP